MFDVGSLESRLELDRSPFIAGLRAARMEGQRFAQERFQATLGVDSAAARAEIDRLKAEKVQVSGNVDLDDAAAVEKVDRLKTKDADVHGNYDLDTAAAEAKIELLRRRAAGIGGGIGGGTGGGGGGNFIGPGMGPASFLFNHPVASGVAAAAPFLPTIGASAVQGVLGAGALGLGLGSAGAVGGAGILATAIPALSGLKGAFEAFSQQQQAAGANAIQSAQQQLQASAAAQQAAEQVSTARTNLARAQVQGDQAVSGAEEQLRNAQQAETLAQKALTQARSDAVRQLQDMRRAAIESVTAEQQAQINLQEARRALAQAPASTSGLELRQLQLNVTEARQALTDAHIARKRSNDDANKAERQGVQQMPQVVAAQNALKQAHQGAADAANNLSNAETQARQSVADAQRQVSDALRAQALQAKEASLQARALAASNDKLGYALSKLPPAGREVFQMLEGIKNQWHDLSMPAQNQFFGLLADGIHTADRLLPGFANSADTSMTAARGAFDHFLGIFNTPDFQTFETTMTHTFAAGIGPLERGVENIGHVLERIAVASAPDVLRMLNGFQDVTHGWEQDTRNAADLQHSVHGTVREFGDWFDLAGSLGHLLSALFITNEQGAKRGGREVEAVSRQLDQWARWIEHHHHDINSFFGQLNDDIGLLLGSAGQIASVVLPAFKPVGDIIHEIVSDLNSLKVGNVSALTVLLGIMAARGIGGKLGLVGAGAGAAGGLTTAETAGGAGAGGIGLGALASRAGGFLLEHPLAGPTGAGAAAAVAFQSLAGKPGTFLGPGIAGLVPDAGEFTHAIRQDLRIQRTFHDKSLSQLEDLRSEAQGQWRRMWETDPAKAQSAGAEAMVRAAHDTARQIGDQIRGMKLGTQLADAVAEGKGDVRKILKDYEQRFEALPPAARDAAVKSAKVELDQLQEMGLITKKQERQTLADLEDMQAQSQRKQRQKWDQFGRITNRLVAGWFGSMTNTVETLLGNKGITGMVNQLLTGVASQHKLKWNATTAGDVVGNLAGFLGIGGGQRGGMTGGWSSFDDRMVPMRGNEAVLRGEDHVPIVSRALQNTYGFGLGDLFARTGASNSIGGRARGGYAYPFSKSMPLGRTDMGIDANTPGAPVGAIGDATVTSQTNAFGPSFGSMNQGMVYRLKNPPKGYSPSSPYVYVYEGLDKVGGASGNLTAGQLLGHIHASYPGIEMGWAAGPSGGALAAPHYSEGQVTAEGSSFRRFLMDLAHGKAVSGSGGIGQIPRIVIHGPKGGIHDGLQGMADHARHAANAYLAKQAAQSAVAGGSGRTAKVGPGALSRAEMRRLLKAHDMPDIMGYVSYAESGWNPNAANSLGYRGLWAEGQAFWNSYGRGPFLPNVFDPNATAETAAAGYRALGLSPWEASRNAGAGGGWGQHLGQPFQDGGRIVPGGLGRVHPPEILVPGGSHGTGVVSQEDTMRLLRKAARGGGDGTPDIKLIVKGDIVSQHADPVEAVIGDRRFPVAVQREITGRNAYGRQLDRMHSR